MALSHFLVILSTSPGAAGGLVNWYDQSDSSVKPINNTEALYYKICQIKTFFTHLSLPTTIL